jgi:hypothetical protein
MNSILTTVMATREVAEDAALALQDQLGRKVEAFDMTTSMYDNADRWLDGYDGSFTFLLDMLASRRRKALSDGQMKGVVNCMAAAARRRASALPVALELVWTIQNATYTLVRPDGSHITFRIKPDFREESGDDKHVVGYMYGYEEGAKFRGIGWLEEQGEGKAVRFVPWQSAGDVSKVAVDLHTLLEVGTDRTAAGEAYALLSNRCCRCGLELTRPDSINRSMGKTCAKKYGRTL